MAKQAWGRHFERPEDHNQGVVGLFASMNSGAAGIEKLRDHCWRGEKNGLRKADFRFSTQRAAPRLP